MDVSRRVLVPAVVAAMIVALTACASGGAGDRGDPGGTDGPDGVDNPVATFQVEDETFKIELATPELVEHVEQLLDGEDIASIPNGLVVRDDPGPNEPWSWHIDPASLEFADAATGVCDGLPSAVEDASITSDRYCPWSAVAIDLEE